MTLENYRKLLDVEGLEIMEIEDDWIHCSSYSFSIDDYGWDGKRSKRLESEWRERLTKISTQIDFCYDDFFENGKIFHIFELSIHIGKMEEWRMNLHDDWHSAIRLVDKYADFSSEVIEAIETALEEI